MRQRAEVEKVLVLWADAHSTNLGVQALAEGTSQLVELISPGAHVEFRSYGQFGDGPRLGLKSIAGAFLGLDSSLRNYLAQFDLVIDTGAGDSFADIYGIRRHLEMSVMRRVVSNAKIPLIMGPQTVGPFTHKASSGLARWSVRGAAAVIARDSVSMNAANEIYDGPILHGSDVVFLIDAPTGNNVYEVMLNVSGLLWNKNPHVDWEFYRTAVTQLASRIRDEGYSVTLLAHVLHSDLADNDMTAITELSDAVGNQFQVVQPTGLQSARNEISGAKVLIASRMHAALNALSTGIPAIPWAYSRKFEPLLDDLGWKHIFDLRECDLRIVEETVAILPEVIANKSAAQEAQKRAVQRISHAADFDFT